MRDGQAPDKFTREYLRDIGFRSSNHHAFIPLLKGLGFLTSDGTPTQRYKEFLDATKWKKVIAEAVRTAYGDLFVIKSKPTKSDVKLIAGKYRSAYNLSDNAADRVARTFLALLDLADKDTLYGKEAARPQKPEEQPDVAAKKKATTPPTPTPVAPKAEELGLHYNIQIHLPATKDIEVYSAIFKSLKEHLID